MKLFPWAYYLAFAYAGHVLSKERQMSWIEQTYLDAYKLATGDGNRHKEAHAAGLEAVYWKTARAVSIRRICRVRFSSFLLKAAERIRP